MNETNLEAVGIHRIQRDLVNRLSIHVTSACTQNENLNWARNMRKSYEVPRWILCDGALLQQKGCSGVGFGLESAFPSVQLALERLVFAWFASGGLACGISILM
jgi:hypothetical protein